ncbi:MAG: hypothetical protein GW947_02170 [Candidatus Pacebacteria bacterium]|nr:hypothetical protein [Candidatus Paceibacterota bacterium]
MKFDDEQLVALIKKARHHKTETDNVEFKDARGGFPSSCWKSISSFSHKPGGGIIVFGIYEDRDSGKIEIVGGLDLAFLQEKIVSFLNEVMQNHGIYSLRIVELDKKELLVLCVSETNEERKPCFNKRLGLPRGACIREGNVDRVITDEEMRAFIRNSDIFKFDKTQASQASIDLLDVGKIKELLIKSAEKAKRKFVDSAPTNKVMKNLGVIDNFNGNYFPTVGGFLIFSNVQPQTLLPFSRYVVRCVRYAGFSVSTPILDKQDILGTLDEQIDLIHQFILRNISLRAEIIGSKRVEKYEYPPEAIRELVANAVIHRDYLITETYTQINIFSNRIEISNPGNLPPGITIENLRDSQFSRNEIIASLLKDLDYLEEYGRGINIVLSRMEEWSLLEPIFKNAANSFKVVLLGDTFSHLNERQIKIWHFLQENPTITAKECVKLSPSASRPTINKDLQGLVQVQLIKLRGAASGTYYEPGF